MNIVITGGAGFLGHHLCRRLLEMKHDVICVDNLLTGREENIKPFLQYDNFLFLKEDVTEQMEIPGEVNYVLHFASPASPMDYLKLPIETLKVGSIGTLNALGLAKAKNAVFMLASTSEVYGDPLENPQSESYKGNVNPIGPRGVYDEAKRFAEALTMAYNRYHNLSTRIARIFNTYGPGMRSDDGRAIPVFINQALRNEKLTIFGDGKQSRSFIYIDDQVDGLLKLLFSDEMSPVNLGTPEEISLLQIAEEIISFSGSKSRIIFKELPVDDPKVRCPDISRAKETLGWEPKVTREEGLKKTIEYFETLL